MKIKSPHSPALRGICSVTFDVADIELSSFRASPEALEDSADHQRKPERSQTFKETQSVFTETDDTSAEQRRLSPDVTGNIAADGTNALGDDDAEHVKAAKPASTDHDIACACDADVVEPNEQTSVFMEPQGTKAADPSERPGSVMSTSEPHASITGNEAMTEEGNGEFGDDVGTKTEKSGEQRELKDEETKTTHEAMEDNNLERPRSAEPHVHLSSLPCKDSETSMCNIRDESVKKRSSRSLRHPKVQSPNSLSSAVLAC